MLAGIRATLEEILERAYRFSQQQRSFITALDHGRASAGRLANQPITSLNEVSDMMTSRAVTKANDTRILETFILICDSLEGLRKEIKRILIDYLQQNDKIKYKQSCKKVVYLLKKWRKLLQADYDFSNLCVKYPHNHVNKLSAHEARETYAGVVSYVPILCDIAISAVDGLQECDDVMTTWVVYGRESVSRASYASSIGSTSRRNVPLAPKPKTASSVRSLTLRDPETGRSGRVSVVIREVAPDNGSSASRATCELARLDTPAAARSSSECGVKTPQEIRLATPAPSIERPSKSAQRPKTMSSQRSISFQEEPLELKSPKFTAFENEGFEGFGDVNSTYKSRPSTTKSVNFEVTESRPKTVSTIRLKKIENVDDGVFHGDSTNAPDFDQNRLRIFDKDRNSSRLIPSRLTKTAGSSRKSTSRSNRSSYRDINSDRKALDSIQNRLKSNPSDISVIQQKLRNLYCRSAASQKSFNIESLDVIAKSPSKPASKASSKATKSRLTRSATQVDDLKQREPITVPTPIEEENQNGFPEFGENGFDDVEINGYQNAENGVALLGIDENGDRETEWEDLPNSPPKASAAPSSRMLRDLLGYEIKSRLNSGAANSDISEIPSLRVFPKNNSVEIPKSGLTSASPNMSTKFTVPRTGNSEKQWQP